MKRSLLAILKNQTNLKNCHEKYSNLFNYRNFYTTKISSSYNQIQTTKYQKYYNCCKLLKLDTEFTSSTYKPLNEKDIRRAFRQQAFLKHPDTDSIPESKPGDAYFEIVQARDYLLQNYNNASCNHLSGILKPHPNTQYAFIEEQEGSTKTSSDDKYQPGDKYQTINTHNYVHNDYHVHAGLVFTLVLLYFILENSNLPPPDPNYPKWTSGRHERRRKQYRQKEKERIKEWKENVAHYEEIDSVSGHIHPLSSDDDDDEIYIPNNYTSIMLFDNIDDTDDADTKSQDTKSK